MKNIFVAAFSIIIALSCSNDGDTFIKVSLMGCDINAPLEELDWLRSEVAKRKNDSSENARYEFISQVDFEEETLFLYRNCNPLANSIIPVYNCNGDEMGVIGDENFSFELLPMSTEIFYPENTLCNFLGN